MILSYNQFYLTDSNMELPNGIGEYKLACQYYKEEKYNLARSYLEIATSRGHVLAKYYLANMYLLGKGGTKEYKKAREYLELFVQNPLPVISYEDLIDAHFNLAHMYHHGMGGSKDYEKARKLYEKAAEEGHPIAYYNLGLMYWNGLGVEIDNKKAEEYFELSAAQDHPPALVFLEKIQCKK